MKAEEKAQKFQAAANLHHQAAVESMAEVQRSENLAAQPMRVHGQPGF